MEVMSAREAADKWGISQRRVAVLCSENRIANVQMLGNMWLIPTDAEKPIDARSTRYNTIDEKCVKPFLKWAGGKGQLLKEIEKRVKEKGASCIELQAVYDDLHEQYYGKAGYKNAVNFVVKVKWFE